MPPGTDGGCNLVRTEAGASSHANVEYQCTMSPIRIYREPAMKTVDAGMARMCPSSRAPHQPSSLRGQKGPVVLFRQGRLVQCRQKLIQALKWDRLGASDLDAHRATTHAIRPRSPVVSQMAAAAQVQIAMRCSTPISRSVGRSKSGYA